MDSQNQLQIFCICVLAGFVGGLGYEIFAFFRLLFGCEREKNRWLGYVLDVLYYILLSLFCIFVAYLLHFPSFRVYTWVGFALGGVLYLKSLRRMVAFGEKMCYNKIRNIIKTKKKLSKTGDENI